MDKFFYLLATMFNKYIKKNLTEFAINTLLFIFGFIFYILGVSIKSNNGAFFLNLSAGCVTSLIIIWVVENFRKQENESKFFEVRKIAKNDINSLVMMLTSHVASPLGFRFLNYKRDYNEPIDEWSRKTGYIVLDEILNRDIDIILEKMNIDDWHNFATNIILIKYSLSENIRVYAQVIPPEILGKILIIRESFNKIDSVFSITPELLLRERKDWPLNKLGVNMNLEIRKNMINFFTKDLREYFSDIKETFLLLDELDFK